VAGDVAGVDAEGGGEHEQRADRRADHQAAVAEAGGHHEHGDGQQVRGQAARAAADDAPKASTSCRTTIVEAKTHSSGRRLRSSPEPPIATARTATTAAASIGQPPLAATIAAVADRVTSVTMRAVRRRSCMSRKRSRWFAVGHSHDEPGFASQASTAIRST
jgi:hypothetical protein